MRYCTLSSRRFGPIAVAIAVAIAAAVLAAPWALYAQSGGTIRGRVTESGSGRPVGDVQIVIEGTRLGAVSDASGNYVLSNVPAGPATLHTRLIGFTPVTRTVDVPASGGVTVDFTLSQAATVLDQIVVTGVPTATSTRTLGNAITTVNAAEVMQKTVTTSVSELLQARAPGVTALQSSGTAGAAGTIRIRGLSSLTGSSSPVIYVDGVRISSGAAGNFRNSWESPNAHTSSRQTGGGQDAGLLSSINPEDIESLEVIKGPAAATLYGADAANGVIQIITKRGRNGEQKPQWRVRAQTGRNSWALDTRTNFTTCTAARLAATDPVSGAPLWPGCQGKSAGAVLSESSLSAPGVLRGGLVGDYTASLTGGGQGYSYLTTVHRTAEDGVFQNNQSSLNSARANFSFYPSDRVNYAVSLSYSQSDISFPMGDNGANMLEAAWLYVPGAALAPGQKPGFSYGSPAEFSRYDNHLRTDRVILGSTVNVTPVRWLTNRFTVGADLSNGIANRYIAPGGQFSPTEGQMTQGEPRNSVYSVDYAGTISSKLPLFPTLSSALSWGAQYNHNQVRNTISQGTGFPSGTVRDINMSTVQLGWTEFVETKSLGFYAQEQVGWQDKLFVTGALRMDNSSVFGGDIKQLYYPKLSASYVISEEPFIRRLGWLDNLKLRAAWGQAGNAPDPFAAVRSYTLVQSVDENGNPVSALSPASLGNPNIKPERGNEVEVGFDAGLLSDRLGIELTYYNKTTKDALMLVPNLPTSGFPGGSYQNVGEINNHGLELSLRATPVSRNVFTWDTQLGFSTNKNKLVKFGYDQTAILIGLTTQNQRNVEGYPLGGFWVHDPVPDGSGGYKAGTPRYLGSADPTRQIFFGNTITLFKGVRLYGLLDYKGGFYVTNQTDWRRCTAGVCPEINDPNVSAERKAMLTADLTVNDALYTQPGDFIKLRDLSVSYDLPVAYVARLGAKRAALQLAAHNVALLWKKGYTGLDPEVNFAGTNGPTGEFGLARVDYWTMPMTRRVTVSLDVTF
jgi:TonB-linked SusC/RagA family outer membrane protein